MHPEQDSKSLLLNASFPVYVVPPSLWDGDVFLSGFGGSTAEATWAAFLYVDEAGVYPPARALEVVTLPERVTDLRTARTDALANFLARVVPKGHPRRTDPEAHVDLSSTAVSKRPVNVLLLGWRLDPDQMARLVDALEPIGKGGSLFDAIRESEMEAWARIRRGRRRR